MRKLFVSILIIILIVIVFFSWSHYMSISEISTVDINSMTITALPSPPKVKLIDKKYDIEKVILFINSIDKKVIMFNGSKGWEFNIQIKGKKEHTIMFVGDRMKIDGIWYKINTDEIKKLRELYNNITSVSFK
jgi:hypothetical protein